MRRARVDVPFTGMLGDLTLCKPSKANSQCEVCRRYAPWIPDEPTERPHTVAIDASTIRRPKADCQMRAVTQDPHRVWSIREDLAPVPAPLVRVMFDASQIGAGS